MSNGGRDRQMVVIIHHDKEKLGWTGKFGMERENTNQTKVVFVIYNDKIELRRRGFLGEKIDNDCLFSC